MLRRLTKMKDYTDAIAILNKAAEDEWMKAAIASTGSLADSYCTRKAIGLEEAAEELKEAMGMALREGESLAGLACQYKLM